MKGGARVNERTADGKSALMFAAAAGHTYTVGALLAAGADPAAIDDSGATAREHAQTAKRSDIASLLRTLEVPPEECFGPRSWSPRARTS